MTEASIISGRGLSRTLSSQAFQPAPPTSVLPSPRELGLPAWVTDYRPTQVTAVEQIVEAFSRVDLCVLDAPTGAGKSLLAELVRKQMGARALYLCTTKTLQDQVVADFPYAKVLKGRANYQTVNGPSHVSCSDCTADPTTDTACMWCPSREECPYIEARQDALAGDLAVLNTSYFLSATNYANTFRGRGLVIGDECDALEKELLSFVEVSISSYRAKSLGIGLPRYVTKPDSWATWLEDIVLPAIHKARNKIPKTSMALRDIRNRQALDQLAGKVARVAPGIASGNWVFDGYREGRITFRPIRVDGFGKEMLWRHGKKWLLMSATVISADELVESLGYDGDWELVTCPATFPVENRRIHVAPVADMAAKLADTEWPKMVTAIDNVIDMHPDERILVHTVSYKLAAYLEKYLRTDRPVFTYTTGADREKFLQKFKGTEGAILLAPSLDRGVSLADGECRVIIVAKMPFASLGDKQVAARLHTSGGQLWYSTQTVRSLVQMTGRAVRHREDFMTGAYILDAQFLKNVWKKSRFLLPEWWVESLNMGFDSRALMKRAV